MTNHPRPMLTTEDHERLQILMTTLIGSRSPLADIVRRKVQGATIVDPENAQSDLVTSGRRVRFTLNGDKSEDRLLSWVEKKGRGSTLCLLQPSGMALLGLRTGEFISFKTGDQVTNTVLVEAVVATDRPRSLPHAPGFNPPPYLPDFECLMRWEDDGGRPVAMRLELEARA